MSLIKALQSSRSEDKSESTHAKVATALVSLEESTSFSGEVQIACQYSSINYKDALGVTGKGPIFKNFPIIPGIDAAGRVISSQSPEYREGDEVVVTGCGIGETYDGGYSERLAVPAASVVALPEGLSLKDAMIYGTAGFTAALAIHRMEICGQNPSQGPIVVTGASGGVGMLAIGMLERRGYEVLAVSGKPQLHGVLRELGATKVIHPDDLELGKRPLESAKYAGVIDSVGGQTLSGLIRHIKLWGNVAVIGLAESARLEGTVMPMILRGVSLLGISSANAPRPMRLEVWRRMAGDLKPRNLSTIHTKTVALDEVLAHSQQMLERSSYGRTLVAIQPESEGA